MSKTGSRAMSYDNDKSCRTADWQVPSALALSEGALAAATRACDEYAKDGVRHQCRVTGSSKTAVQRRSAYRRWPSIAGAEGRSVSGHVDAVPTWTVGVCEQGILPRDGGQGDGHHRCRALAQEARPAPADACQREWPTRMPRSRAGMGRFRSV